MREFSLQKLFSQGEFNSYNLDVNNLYLTRHIDVNDYYIKLIVILNYEIRILFIFKLK